MKILKHTLFIFAIVIGFSLTTFAQKGGQDKPPKEKPPVVNPEEKKPPKEKPSEGDKPKKPNVIFVKTENETLTAVV